MKRSCLNSNQTVAAVIGPFLDCSCDDWQAVPRINAPQTVLRTTGVAPVTVPVCDFETSNFVALHDVPRMMFFPRRADGNGDTRQVVIDRFASHYSWRPVC
jgi:hypothetical protein